MQNNNPKKKRLSKGKPDKREIKKRTGKPGVKPAHSKPVRAKRPAKPKSGSVTPPPVVVPPPNVIDAEHENNTSFNEQVERLSSREKNEIKPVNIPKPGLGFSKAKIVRSKHKPVLRKDNSDEYEYIEQKDNAKERTKKYALLALILLCFLAGIFLLFWGLGLFDGEVPDYETDENDSTKIVEAPEINSNIPDVDDGKIKYNKRHDNNSNKIDSENANTGDKHPYAKHRKTLGTFEYIGYVAYRCVSGYMHKIKIDGEISFPISLSRLSIEEMNLKTALEPLW